MTNEEKYKTPDERRVAFRNACVHICKNGPTHNCIGCPYYDNKGTPCVLHWLKDKYDPTLALPIITPCPFCRSEAAIISVTEGHYVVCQNENCAAALIARCFSSAEEAISAWNRRA